MAKKIGMGLDRLLSEVRLSGDTGKSSSDTVKQLALDNLQPSQYQPRTVFSNEELQGLADSIKQHGVLQPIVVRFLPDLQVYEIIAGERRWRAAKLAGLDVVPAVVRELSDQQAMALAIIENLQREDLSTWELMQALHKLVQEFHLTHESAAKLISRSRSSVTNLLRLLELPAEVLELLQQQKIEMGHARALLMVNDAKMQIDIARRVALHGLTVRAVEKMVKQGAFTSAATKEPYTAESSKHDWEARLSKLSSLSKKLAIPLQLKLNKTKSAGKVVISFKNTKEFEELVAKLHRLSQGKITVK